MSAVFYILREIYEAPWIDLDEDGVYGGKVASLVDRLPGPSLLVQWAESVR